MKELIIYATAYGITFELKEVIYYCVKGFKDELEPILDDYNKYCYHRDNVESIPPNTCFFVQSLAEDDRYGIYDAPILTGICEALRSIDKLIPSSQ